MLCTFSTQTRRRRFAPVVRNMIGSAVLVFVALTCCGCVGPGRSLMNPFTVTDRRDPTDEVDSWTSEVGMDARGNRARDNDPDPWWGKYVISEKHREIERNLGVDYD